MSDMGRLSERATLMTQSEVNQDRAIANNLPKTWDAFFARFGRLTAIQRQAIPFVLAGRQVLLCAPTASGKTEAICAPLFERLLSKSNWTVLYVSPTRALVNDLYERLVGPCSNLGISVMRRTGDHPRVGDTAPNVLITTPESFDSLLCRARRKPKGHLLANVRNVVLDEIHLLYGTSRGEQVRWLLERLRRLRSWAREQGWSDTNDMGVHALSATVGDPPAVLKAYVPGGDLVSAAGFRTIEQVSADCRSPALEDALPASLSGKDAPKKVLVFANSRKRVDALCHRLKGPLETAGYKVRAHHSSLAPKVREESEEAAKSIARVVLFATSTLEIGIDIGDIDLVVLDGPAPDVRALLQRIGRGNRRTSKTRVMACSGSMAEVLIHAAMLHQARGGFLPPQEIGPCFAVARQQLASYIFQHSLGIRAKDNLEELMRECLPERKAAELLDHMVSTAELEAVPDGLRLGRDWVEATSTGDVHSNIESKVAQTVIDDVTGEALASGIKFGGGDGILIGGQLLKVKDSTTFTVTVRATTDKEVLNGKWNYVTGSWFQGAGQATAVRDFLGIESNSWPIVRANDVTAIFHFGGARRRAVLELALEKISFSFLGVDGWAIYVNEVEPEKPPVLTTLQPSLIDSLVPTRLPKLEKTLARPQANRGLPIDWRIAEVTAWLGVDQECEAIRSAKWAIQVAPDLNRNLQILVSGLHH